MSGHPSRDGVGPKMREPSTTSSASKAVTLAIPVTNKNVNR
jgi:hypothetical protein